MPAIASSPSAVSHPRFEWPTSSGEASQVTAKSAGSDDPSRMLVPRRSAQRSNSSSSVSTNSSTNSVATATSAPVNGTPAEDANWGTRKKPAASRGLWPASKAEPVAGLSTARPQSVGAGVAGPSAATTMTALTSSTPNGTSQQLPQTRWQLNGGNRAQAAPENPVILHLLPINGTFESKTITVPFAPDVLRIGRQTNQKTIPTPLNGYFDSKVLSRQHAELWAERDGKIWIRDVKSSNGTFVNGKRLSQENRDSEPHLLKEQDVLELGIDIVSEDQKTVVHHKVAARVERAGLYGFENSNLGLNGTDLDASGASGGVMLQAQPNGRGRSSSQGSASNGRSLQGAGLVNQYAGPAAYHPKWLQPLSMEQIVKRIHAELKQARIQSSDLRHTGNLVNVIATDGAVPEQPSPRKKSFSYPTSPPLGLPPSQTLPEAPANTNTRAQNTEYSPPQPLLRRTDTERPKLSSPSNGRYSPTKSGSSLQIRGLVEALTTAKKQITSKDEKLKEVEEALHKEREDRKIADERAQRLESGSSMTLTAGSIVPGEEQQQVRNNGSAESDVKRLQSLLDTMHAEMEEMKLQMERYRSRAESAEEEGRGDRESLAEMVESIRKREVASQRRKDKRQKRVVPDVIEKEKFRHIDASAGAYSDATLEEAELNLDALDEEINNHVSRAITRLNGNSPSYEKYKHEHTIHNGSARLPLSIKQLQELGQAAISSLLPPTQHSNSHDTSAESSVSYLKDETGTLEVDGNMVEIVEERLTHAEWSRKVRTDIHSQSLMVESAPYASLFGVVLFGVGLMAYLNGMEWQKVVSERS